MIRKFSRANRAFSTFFDSNDTLNAFHGLGPKIRENLPQGDIESHLNLQTFGLWEYIAHIDDNMQYCLMELS